MRRRQYATAEYQISDISSEVRELAFNAPVHLPFGEIVTRPSLIVSADIAEPNSLNTAKGMAEGASLPMPIPMYDDCSDNLLHNSLSLGEKLVGKTLSIDAIRDIIGRAELGGSYATARMTVEAALLDAIARANDDNVYGMLTSETLETPLAVPYGKSITEVDGIAVMQACELAVRAGAKRLKFKISPDSFGQVYDAISTLMRIYTDHDFMVDANGMFDPLRQEHLRMIGQLDELGLMTIEEPVSRVGDTRGLAAHHALRARIDLQTPITMDDAIKSPKDAQLALTEGLAEIVNLKPGRMGSFLLCVDIAHLAKDLGGQVMVGGMFESTPGRYMTTTLAAYCTKLGFTIPGDLSLPSERLHDDLVQEKMQLDSDGSILFYPKKGWGYEL